MARPTTIDQELVQKAQTLVAQTTDLQELLEAQSILLPALHGTSLEQTASLLGVSRATVHRLQVKFRAKCRGRFVVKPHGGRRRVLMSLDQERAFLRPWAQQAKEGGVLVVSAMRADLSQQLGRPVAASVLYRLLARHGWRKVAPDTRHPKSDPKVQEDWKKNSPKRWVPC
ncbi:MAG: winged helix-turn-helix domain-containing protein [Chloroflexi bacterium]|nr:winged helix-turn-helix domain-containing protein [Chloroflexota bacterium]